ncbi:MAG: hypothetical protein V4655_12010, partial [Bdellovibrionota bacterium]
LLEHDLTDPDGEGIAVSREAAAPGPIFTILPIPIRQLASKRSVSTSPGLQQIRSGLVHLNFKLS